MFGGVRKQPEPQNRLAAYATLILGTAILYAPVRHFAFLNWDDDLYVLENRMVQAGFDASTLAWSFNIGYAGNWHPLTWWSHMLDWQLFGDHAGAHHLVNVAIHILSALLLLTLLLQLGWKLPASFFIAGLFAWHPQHVESVAWVAERKDVLAALFALLTLLSYVHYRQGWRHGYWIALGALALSLSAKGMAVTLPCVMLLLDIGPLKRFPSLVDAKAWRAAMIEKLPFFLLSFAACVLTVLAQREQAIVSLHEITFPMRVMTTLIAYGFYVWRFLVPLDLAVPYPYPDAWPISRVALSAGLLLACTALAWRSWRHTRLPMLGWCWFLGMLVPVIGLVQVGHQAYADRYTYLPTIGLAIFAVGLARALPRRPRQIAATTCLFLCAGLTAAQVHHWQDSETLFRHTISVTDDNVLALANLGHALIEQGRAEDAIPLLLRAHELSPGHHETSVNLGNALMTLGRSKEALEFLEVAHQYHPNAAEIRNNLAIALAQTGNSPRAIELLQETIHLAPEDADAPCNLGVLLSSAKQHRKALPYFALALERDPNHQTALQAQADVSLVLGEVESALRGYERLLAVVPAFAPGYNNYATALQRAGRTAEAISAAERAVALQADLAVSWHFLASRYLEQKRPDPKPALHAAKQAVIHSGRRNATYLLTYAAALGKAGQLKPALDVCNEALALAPNSATAQRLKNALRARMTSQ